MSDVVHKHSKSSYDDLMAQDKYGKRLMNWVRLRETATNASIFFANTHGPLGQCGGEAGAQAAANYKDRGFRFGCQAIVMYACICSSICTCKIVFCYLHT